MEKGVNCHGSLWAGKWCLDCPEFGAACDEMEGDMTSKIEWCEETWNPITGCTPISEGCAHCYAKRMAPRFRGRFGYPADDPFKVTFHPDKLEKPLHWKKPRRIFVCSMGDLFHEDVDHWQRNAVFEAMDAADWHTYLLLTKRPFIASQFDEFRDANYIAYPHTPWKDHIWLGVTAENQARFDERWTILDQIPAAVKFVSIEPMLSPVDIDIFAGWPDWVIAGCESGPGRRPAKIEWFRDLKNQCVDARVPFFLKQMEDDDGKLEKMPTLDGRTWAVSKGRLKP